MGDIKLVVRTAMVSVGFARAFCVVLVFSAMFMAFAVGQVPPLPPAFEYANRENVVAEFAGDQVDETIAETVLERFKDMRDRMFHQIVDIDELIVASIPHQGGVERTTRVGRVAMCIDNESKSMRFDRHQSFVDSEGPKRELRPTTIPRARLITPIGLFDKDRKLEGGLVIANGNYIYSASGKVVHLPKKQAIRKVRMQRYDLSPFLTASTHVSSYGDDVGKVLIQRSSRPDRLLMHQDGDVTLVWTGAKGLPTVSVRCSDEMGSLPVRTRFFFESMLQTKDGKKAARINQILAENEIQYRSLGNELFELKSIQMKYRNPVVPGRESSRYQIDLSYSVKSRKDGLDVFDPRRVESLFKLIDAVDEGVDE